MNLFDVGFVLIVFFGYEYLKAAAVLKLSPPWINVVRQVGDSYKVKCEGKGQKIWRYSNGQIINDHSGSSIYTEKETDNSLYLKFVNIRKEYKGMYNCSSKLESRKPSVGFELVVIQPLSLVTNETNEVIVLNQGDDAVLECNTEGQPPPIISWFFNGILKIIEENVEKSSYSVNNVSPEQDGKYTCRAFQKISQLQDIEVSFNIKVYQKPTPLFQNQRFETDHLVVYGFRNESRNLTCAVKAYPIAYFVWYKDSRLMDFRRNGIKVYNDENKSILEILLDDFSVLGLYECEAANLYGLSVQRIEYTWVNTPQTPRLCYYERNDTSAIISVYLEPYPIENFTCKIEYTKFTWHKGEEKWRTAHVMFCFSERVPNTNKIHCKIRNLQPLTKYAVRAALRNPGGLGNFSNEIIFRTRSESSNSISLKVAKSYLLFCFFIILAMK